VTQAITGVSYRLTWNAGTAMMSLQGHAEWQRTLSQHGSIAASFTAVDARSPLALDLLGPQTTVLGIGLATDWPTSRLTLAPDARRSRSTADLGLNAAWAVSF